MTAASEVCSAILLGSILGLAAARAAADPARIEPSPCDDESRYQKLVEVRQALLARRAAIDARLESARDEWDQATAEFNRLEPERRALRMESALLEHEHVIPLGRFTTAQRGQYNRITNQLRQLTAQYNDLQATGLTALVRRQEALRQQSDAWRDLHELGRESDALRRQWLAGLDFLRLRSSAEHEALRSMFVKLLEHDPDNAGALLGRGLADWKLGHLDDAASAFQRVVTLDEGCAASALAAQARLECELGKTDAGQADFAKALKLDRTNARLYLLRGMAAAADGNYVAAQHDFETANRSSEITSQSFRLLALLHATWSTSHSDDHARQALGDAQRACQLSADKDWACLAALAAAQAALGRFDDAVDTTGRAAELAIDDNRRLCLEQIRRYRTHEPSHIDWR